MKYRYFYQTSRNESRDGWIAARDRNDAYAQLRRQGIRPYKVIGRNPPAWKRWTAIGVLSGAVAVLAALRILDANPPGAVAEVSFAGERADFAAGRHHLESNRSQLGGIPS